MPKTEKSRVHVMLDSASLVGIKARKSSDLIGYVQRGLPVATLKTLGERTGLTSEQVRVGIGMTERTLARRRKQAEKLTSEESDRVLRVSRVFSSAVGLFEGDAEAARQWFVAPNRAFAGQSPLDMIQTEVGAREVENLIGRLEHGVFS